MKGSAKSHLTNLSVQLLLIFIEMFTNWAFVFLLEPFYYIREKYVDLEMFNCFLDRFFTQFLCTCSFS